MKKFILIFILCLAFALVSGFIFLITTDGWVVTHETNLSDYDNYLDEFDDACKEFMPKLNTFENFNRISTGYIEHTMTAFSSIMLKIEFSENEYYKNKDFCFEKYEFLSQPVISISKSEYELSEPIFYVYGYEIMVAYNKQFFYPKYFGMIGFNDKDYVIVFLYVYEISLDYICEINDTTIGTMAEYTTYHFPQLN